MSESTTRRAGSAAVSAPAVAVSATGGTVNTSAVRRVAALALALGSALGLSLTAPTPADASSSGGRRDAPRAATALGTLDPTFSPGAPAGVSDLIAGREL